MKKRRLLTVLLATAVAAGMSMTSAFADDGGQTWQDGTWQGTQWGYSSNITMTVTVENGKITKLDAEQDETPRYWSDAVKVCNSIIDKQSVEVDTISGATVSSKAILGAVSQALAKASGDETVFTEPQAEWFAGGSGTKDDPYLIRTEEQLLTVSNSLNGDIRYKDCWLKLDADLDLSDVYWRPIGSNSFPFAGHFDGAGHTIRGLVMGDRRNAYAARTDSRFLGLFGVVDATAEIRNVEMKDVAIYAEGDVSIRAGAVVGQSKGAKIDHVWADGILQTTSRGGNDIPGGVVGRMDGGSLTNSGADVQVISNCSADDFYLEAGGLAGMVNGGLVANCYALGDVTATAGKDSVSIIASSLVGEQCGDVVNCYTDGDLTTSVKTSMAGAVSGDIDGGRSYNCWYNEDMTMKLGEETITPVRSYGKTYDKAMDYPGTYYVGNMVLNLMPYKAAERAAIAEEMNKTFAAFPVDITKYGLGTADLLNWKADGQNVTPTGDAAEVTYARPAEEVIEQVVQPMKDGTWYGRSADKSVVVKITTSGDNVTTTDVISGDSGAEGYAAALEEAVNKAREKAIYNDQSAYSQADPSVFAGGKGTSEDPYQIANEAQLRYIAEAVNEDVNWENTWFRQTADITLSDQEWLPIGYSIFGYYRSRWIAYQTYPFLGNYDGGGYTITGLRIGTKDKATEDPRMTYTAGMFGVVKGTVSQNYPLDTLENAVQRQITNVNLKDVIIHVNNNNGIYAGALIAQPGNGFLIDRCSVSGTVNASGEKGNLYAGGLIGYGLRGGLIMNSSADVAVSVTADREQNGNVYAGGFMGSDNRVTTVNSYALGSVKADGKANRIYAGGFSGSCAGANYNVYAAGSVESANETKTAGSLAGSLLYIGAYYHSFADSTAALTVNGNAAEKTLFGTANTTDQKNRARFATPEEFANGTVAEDMNVALSTIKTEMVEMQEGIGDDPIHSVYYTGDGSDLMVWSAGEKGLTLTEKAAPAKPAKDDSADKAKAAAKAKAKAQKMTVKGLKVKSKAKKAVVTFKKTKGASAYQIQYKLKSAKKWKNLVKSTKKVKVTSKKLKKGKKYTFRVRTITKVNGAKVYGKWAVKTVKIK